MIDPLEYTDYVRSLVRARFNGSEIDDLVAVGYYALVKASKMFKADRGACFKTYLTIKVMGEVRNYLRVQPTQYHRSKKSRITLTQFSTINNAEEGEYQNSIEGAETFYDIDFLKRKLRKNLKPDKNIEMALKHYLDNKSYKDLQKEYSLDERTICRRITKGRELIKLEIEDTVLV